MSRTRTSCRFGFLAFKVSSVFSGVPSVSRVLRILSISLYVRPSSSSSV